MDVWGQALEPEKLEIPQLCTDCVTARGVLLGLPGVGILILIGERVKNERKGWWARIREGGYALRSRKKEKGR